MKMDGQPCCMDTFGCWYGNAKLKNVLNYRYKEMLIFLCKRGDQEDAALDIVSGRYKCPCSYDGHNTIIFCGGAKIRQKHEKHRWLIVLYNAIKFLLSV